MKQLPTGEPLLSVFVADGAGSALRGGDGADLAVQVAATFVCQVLCQCELGLSDGVATELVLAIRERIFTEAEVCGLLARDFACTLIGVLSTPHGTIVLQIGDGGAVVDIGAGLELAIAPMTGEYANMTHFVTDDDAIAVLATRTYTQQARRIAAFSDGVQRLAVDLATNQPHEPFFRPFFEEMERVSIEEAFLLDGLLSQFLASQAVNDRTDDDKTLALAVWVP